MNTPDSDRLREMPQRFDLAGATGLDRGLGPPRRVKVFKSGNSLAVRMPSGLGLEAGMELELTLKPGGGYLLDPIAPVRRKIDISGFAGKLPGFKPAPRRDFDDRPSTLAARDAARKAALGE